LGPAAETGARTTVLSNVCTTSAVRLHSGSRAKNASNIPARLSRGKRFQTLFQGPNRSGDARQALLRTAKSCSVFRNRRSSRPFAPRLGRQARNTSSEIARSASVIFVDTANPPKVGSP